MCDKKEVWYILENGGKGSLVGIATNVSRWFIAEEVSRENAIIITNLFNKGDVPMYRVKYPVQDTMETKHIGLTGLMSYKSAIKVCETVESAKIIIDSQFT